MGTNMKNKSVSLKHIFIQRMIFSALIQFLVLGLILILVKNYFNYNQQNSILLNLIINDIFTNEEIGKYQFLNNKYALNLELHNLADERKLDSIKLYNSIDEFGYLGSCTNIADNGYKICKTTDGVFSGVSPIKVDNKIISYIVAKKKYNLFFYVPISYGLLLILFFVSGVFLFNFLFLFFSMKKKIEVNTDNLLTFISSDYDSVISPDLLTIDEYKIIAAKFVEERFENEKLQINKALYEAKKKISAQVAHDIRSPLAALTILTSEDLSLPEESRILLRNVTNRIRDIANDLVEKNQGLHNEIISIEDCSIQLLAANIFQLISEKRLQFRSYPKITIEFEFNQDNYGLFANINSEFKRILSNLINNAVEALPGEGHILITMSRVNGYIQLVISDNGKGIPQNILESLGKFGATYDKKMGSGIGLYHAKCTMEKFGGNIQIQSELNKGTDIILTFPQALIPNWFLSKIELARDTTVVILDDDISIYQLWEKKFSHYNSKVKIINFTTSSQFYEWHLRQQKKLQLILYLFDFELHGSDQTGLELIEKYQLQNNGILVTSHSEDKKIRHQCENFGVKMIPKDLAAYIPIVFN